MAPGVRAHLWLRDAVVTARITAQCTGPGLALLAPAGDRERSTTKDDGVAEG
jgi:hypothetical protein